MQKQKKQTEQSQSKPSIMSKNVTEFRHFLKHSHITQNDIDWAINLRSYNNPNSFHKKISANVPSVYFKQTKLQQIKNTLNIQDHSKQNKPVLNMGQFMHLTNRVSQPKYSNESMRFHASLGNGALRSQPNKLGMKFCNLPFKDRKQFPKVLKKQHIKKQNYINKEYLQSTFDGNQNYPQYTEKILKQRNITNLEHLVKAKNNLPNIAWHVNLRNYS